MKLIIVAHKLEAYHFFLNYSFKKSSQVNSLYENENFFLFICQMGSNLAYQNLKNLLSHYNPFELIINLGIAGAINDSLKLHSICPIKSLTDASNIPHNIDTPDGSFSCFTSEKKILTSVDAYALKTIDLVDMESYGLYQASREHNTPFYSYKIISDFPNQSTNETIIKNNFDTYSKLLFDYFNQQILPLF